MTRKQETIAMARALGVAIGQHRTELTADAPTGKVFSATRTHCVVAAKEYDDEPYTALWGALRSDLRYGIENCKTDNCDVCNDA